MLLSVSKSTPNQALFWRLNLLSRLRWGKTGHVKCMVSVPLVVLKACPQSVFAFEKS